MSLTAELYRKQLNSVAHLCLGDMSFGARMAKSRTVVFSERTRVVWVTFRISYIVEKVHRLKRTPS